LGRTIAIVGGGFCGVATAWHLLALARAGEPMKIHLVERQPPVGQGVAYAEGDPGYLLNVPVAEMSLDPTQPGHFLAWLLAHGYSAGAGDFVPRAWYGRYLQDSLRAAGAAARPEHSWTLEVGEAINVLPEGGGYAVRFADGRILLTDHIVLALGLMPPAERAFGLHLPPAGPWLVRDPWAPFSVAPLLPGSEALVLGAGLTAVDVALALLDSAGAARVHLVSRRGARLLPWQHAAAPLATLPEPWPLRASQWVNWARRTLRAGVDSATLVATLRPLLPDIWQCLPWVERRRFLRHARGFWESARQRLPVPTAKRLDAAVASGRLVLHRARVVGWQVDHEEVTATVRESSGSARLLTCQRVVLATGPEGNYRRVRHPLVQAFLGSGLARLDPLGLGLDVDTNGRLRDEEGSPSSRLWALGSVCRGVFWESTAVPELRLQAVQVAQGIWQTP